MIKIISYAEYSGFENMSIDLSILDDSIKNNSQAVLRLYGWKRPTLTIGRNQSLSGINQEYCKLNSIDIVKRPTGGRAVLHDKELTYCFITPVNFLKNSSTIASSYREISQALVEGFKSLGINLSFPENKKISVQNNFCMAISTGADLNYKGKKIIGSAQFRKNNYILQHGSILIDIDREIISNIFSSEHSDHNMITIKEIRPDILKPDQIEKAIIKGFKTCFENKNIQIAGCV